MTGRREDGKRRWGVLLVMLLVLSCGSPTEGSSPVAGTWIATQLTVTPTGQAQLDVLAAGGNLSITITSTNVTSGSLNVPASVNGGTAFSASMAGTASLNGGETEVTFTQSADTFVRDLTWQRVGNNSLRVSNQVAGSASFTVTLTKQ